MCRESGNSCDLPEFCTGADPHCPANVYLHDGHACHAVEGYCYNGICQTHEQQCITLWGPGRFSFFFPSSFSSSTLASERPPFMFEPVPPRAQEPSQRRGSALSESTRRGTLTGTAGRIPKALLPNAMRGGGSAAARQGFRAGLGEIRKLFIEEIHSKNNNNAL